MKSSVTLWLATLLFFVLLSILTFNCIWSNGMIFSSGDLNIGRLAQIKNSAPDFTTGIFNSGPIMGQVGFSFLLFKLILSIMPLEIFANSIYGIILIAGSLSMVWFLRSKMPFLSNWRMAGDWSRSSTRGMESGVRRSMLN